VQFNRSVTRSIDVSTEAGTTARWWVSRTLTTLQPLTRGPQRPVEHLEALRHARTSLDAATTFMVDAARAEGATWADIGRALGISRQAARQAAQRRHDLDAARTEAKTWNMPLPVQRRRLRWFRRRAS
jgi:hypothetical protein